MDIKYYPDNEAVCRAKKNNDPLLLLVAFDQSELLVSNIDDAMEHVVLLRKMGYRETAIDFYYRVIVNNDGADWTFVCPSEYKGLRDRNKRIEVFYNDGSDAISKALSLLKFSVNINIPDRYRRHFNELSE
jgi:hypothetical protein